ncbi:amidohydrolase family protein [Allokutzneria sp. A3M-2-11 16]|uniref:amidohydrolase family protein n=1 Tax=Allokutzneria sp. A3M-2-11 16 TaxID=2962043 RepID=UPI0020B7DEFC|nr:amidohydrolase family protein [Allokutzneria sp. A3M-2-11 16]MCP3801303.1 amidohydrolase family protein [Allokutzneria sp. A3M-2-11 16]
MATLVQDACVYTADTDNRVIPTGSVLIIDGRIAAVGTAAEIGPTVAQIPPDQLTVLDARRMMVLPGFVNGHWHETFALRLARPNSGFLSCGGDLHQVSASFDSSADFGDLLTPDEAEAVARYSMWTQLRSGVTTLGDAGSINRPEALAKAAHQLGMRCAVSTWAADAVCLPDEHKPTRTRDADAVLARVEALLPSRSDLVRCRPSAIYVTNMTDELGRGLAELTARHDLPFATHVGALRNEAEVMLRYYGTTGVRRLDELGLVTDRLMAVHCGFADEEERQLLRAAGAQVNISPAKYGMSGETALTEGTVADLEISLSTDGLPLPLPGMTEAMRAAWHGFVERTGDPATLLPTDALAMATRVPARGLRWPDIGSLAVGNQADLVLVPTEDWRYLLQPKPLETFLSLGCSNDVDTVIVGGEVLISGGRGTRTDEDALREDYLSALASFSSRCLGIEAAAPVRSARRRAPRRDRHAS